MSKVRESSVQAGFPIRGWFAESPPDFRHDFLALAREKSYAAGNVIFQAGEVGQDVFGIYSGVVTLQSRSVAERRRGEGRCAVKVTIGYLYSGLDQHDNPITVHADLLCTMTWNQKTRTFEATLDDMLEIDSSPDNIEHIPEGYATEHMLSVVDEINNVFNDYIVHDVMEEVRYAQEFLDTIRMNGGATYNVDTCEFVEWRFGFAIGMASKRCLSREEIEPETVWLKVHAIASRGATDHVGLWIDDLPAAVVVIDTCTGSPVILPVVDEPHSTETAWRGA